MATQQTRELVTPMHILASHSEDVRRLAEQLRALIRDTVPVTERAYAGWHGIGYHHPGPDGGYLCSLLPRRDAVRLLFEEDAGLLDDEGLLREEARPAMPGE